MEIDIRFEYSFAVTNHGGETIEGGGSTEISVEDDDNLDLVDVYTIAVETVLDEFHNVRMEGEGLDEMPDVTVSIRNLSWGPAGGLSRATG